MATKKIIISNLIFFTGIAFGLALAVLSIWADYEAVRYFFTGAVYDQFAGLRCPVLAARADTSILSASINNQNDQIVHPVYDVEVSGPLGRSFREQISIPPHQTQGVEWTVGADDVALHYFIMSKITVLGFATTPTRDATCGIFVLDLAGLTGTQALGTSLTISLLGILIGVTMWEGEMKTVARGVMQPRQARRVLGILVLLAVLSGLGGWWAPGFLFCAVAVLLIVNLLVDAFKG